jgi:hypothetical protein
MSLQNIISWLVLALILSVVGMAFATQTNLKLAHILMAGAAAGGLMQVSLVVNLPYWRGVVGSEGSDDARVDAARRNARLIAIVYVWGAVALIAIYYLTRLSWYHAWQYAAGMALIAAGILAYVHVLGRQGSLLRQPFALQLVEALTALQVIVAAGGLGFLLGTGKLMTRKDDWAANDVFLMGGLAIIVLSVHALLSQQCLRRRQRG